MISTPQARRNPEHIVVTPQAPKTIMRPHRTPNPDADVRVFLRIRPLFPNEEPADIEIKGNEVIARPPPRAQNFKHFAERMYTFSEVFNSEASQAEIFDKVAMPLLRRFMHDVDALLFAYGATSAGKTFTVQGTPQEPGLIPRIVKTLLATAPPKNTERGLLISCVEVYNEKIMDLFGDTTKTLRIGKDGFGQTTVKGAIEKECNSNEDLMQMLKNIDTARRQCSTKCNAKSSRSHCIFMLKLVTIPIINGKRTTNLSQIKCTRLSIVDLAGSERVSPTETNAQVVAEACNINRSMLVLGRCIREIRKINKGGYAQIPFRESKLTELFRDFFEPNGKKATMSSVIVNISPSTAQFDDTLFSLQFAAEAVECNVRNGEEDNEYDDEDLPIAAINFDSMSDDNEEDIESDEIKDINQREAKIRQEIHEEMAIRVKKIQDDYQQQIEQMRAQSAQPYTSKLQQALAQRMQMENRSKELEECMKERDREKQKVAELEAKIEELRKTLDETNKKLEETIKKNTMLESNITKMIDATKKLHERHLEIQSDLQNKAAQIEKIYHEKAKVLEDEIERLKKQQN
ncbi:Kinesin motor domain containing protein [Histomonas meleagridis]|uniref:Kinesin motor domain containing protein n=1 Tax=Histomonas meleagridis TaxID=135588 RepID=UPI003559A13D|nr:Kinesin motor domain containing protein [Histomonas meleagridis]KAH0805332.1 Kinesin motor domain containing protein [Histomonas meleagridis]